MDRLEKIPNRFEEDIILGEQLFRKGKAQEALAVFQSVLERDPKNIAALNNKGVVLNTLGLYEEAVSTLEGVIRAERENTDVVFNLVANLFVLKKLDRAEEILVQYGHHLSPGDLVRFYRDLTNLKFGSEDSINIKTCPLSVRLKSRAFTLNLQLDIQKYTQKIIWEHLSSNAVYEPETLQFISETLEEGDCFIDVGTHVGFFSLIASKLVGENGQVVSFEPEISNFMHLQRHIAINSMGNILPINAAVGPQNEDVEFYFNSDNDGGHALWNVGRHPQCQKTRHDRIIRQTRMITLDCLFNEMNIDSCKLIKIDTEGAELGVLKGATESVERGCAPIIICEVNRFGMYQMGTSEKELRSFMYGLGYESYLMTDKSPGVLKLEPEEYVKSNFVFNLLFKKEGTG